MLFKVLYYKIKHVSFLKKLFLKLILLEYSCFIFCFFLMHYLHEKHYKSITVQSHTADCVSWVPGLTLLESPGLLNKLYLQMRSQNGTRLYTGDLRLFEKILLFTTHVTNRKYNNFSIKFKKKNLKYDFGVKFGAHKSHSLWLKQKMSWYILLQKKKKRYTMEEKEKEKWDVSKVKTLK